MWPRAVSADNHITLEHMPIVEVRRDIDGDVPDCAVPRSAVVEHKAHDTMGLLRGKRELQDVGAHVEGCSRLVEVVLSAEARVRLVETERKLCGLVADLLRDGALRGCPGMLGKHEVSR